MDEIATWEHTVVGPDLFVCGVLVRQWLGTRHDTECALLSDSINRAYAARVVPDTGGK